jgi:hypothetical protein
VRVRRMMRLDFSLAIQKKFEKVLREGWEQQKMKRNTRKIFLPNTKSPVEFLWLLLNLITEFLCFI